jgi:hypothetical protein
MNTITKAFLQAQVDLLNRATNSPIEPWTRDGEKCIAQIGNYHISGAYGGVSLHRMVSQSGGVSDVFRSGHIPKRDLSDRIGAMLVGIEAATPVAA